MISARLCLRKNIPAEKWDEFVKKSPQYIIYALSGYLDCACENWSAIIVRENEEWIAVMPLNINRKLLQSYSLKPPLVQYLGIFLKKLEGKMHRIIHLKKIIIEEIIKTIPSNIGLFNHNFSPGFDYFIPFHWNNYKIQPFHSYCLPLESSIETIYNNFSESVTKRIVRSEKLKLKCIENNSILNLVKIMVGRKIITSEVGVKFEKLWAFITSINAGFVIYITDPITDQVYCGGAFLRDSDRIILLASALDFRFKRTGAHALLVWKGIKKAIETEGICTFDFEGSMIKSIENYTRAFGATPVVYYNISKNSLSLPVRIGYFLKESLIKRSKLKTIEMLVKAD